MADPRTIAAGLSEAMRNAVLYQMSCYADPNTVRALRRRGLANGIQLTELGLAVRAILESDHEPE